MLKQAFRKKRSIVAAWLLSYVAILFVPIVIGGILYQQALRVVHEEINRSNHSLLLQIRDVTDHKLKEIERLALEISMNRMAGTLINATEPLTDLDHYDILTLSKDLAVYKLANDITDELYIYFRNSRTLVGYNNRASGNDANEMLKPLQLPENADWQQFFEQKYVKGFIPLWRTDIVPGTERWILYAQSMLLQNPQMPGATIMFLFDGSKLLSQLDNMNGTQVLILNQQGHVMASLPGEHAADFPSYSELQDDLGILNARHNGEKVTISYQTSAVTGWKYVTVTKASVFFEKVEYLRNALYVGFAVCLALGTAITWLSLKRNYNPIRSLIASWSQRSGLQPDDYSNEFEFIGQVMNLTIAEKDRMYERLKMQSDVVRANLLNRLLKGKLEAGVTIHESLEAHEIHFEHSHFAVLLIRIEDNGKFVNTSLTSSSAEPKLLHFFIANVIEETFGKEMTALMVESDSFLACIVNTSADCSVSRVQQCTAEAHDFIRTHTHARLTTAISSIHRGLPGIPLAYEEALEAMEYRFVVGSGGELIVYEAIRESRHEPGTGYYYPLQIEQQMINYLRIGDYEHIRTVFDEWFHHNFNDSRLSAPVARCLMFDFASTILKTLYEMDMPDLEELLDRNKTLDQLLTCTLATDMKVQMTLYLQEVCEWLSAAREANKPRWHEEIARFVRDCYTDSNLNISMVGDHFGLTPSYLSKRFKEESGESLLEFINRLRIEEAKRLLVERQELPINEISRAVGYSEINTFNRVFKKLEGVTPSMFKGISQNYSKNS